MWVKTPVSGKAAKGMMEVAGMGMGSVTHQVAHTAVMAAVQAAS